MRNFKLRRKIAIVPLICVAMAASGCSGGSRSSGDNVAETDTSEYGYQIYCTDSEVSQLTSWGYDMDEDMDKEDKLTSIMTAFMSRPHEYDKKSAVPDNLAGLTYTVQVNVANVDLDSSFNSLNSLEQLFFKVGLVMTVTQIEGIDYVYLTVDGQPLTDEDGVNIRYFTRNSFIMYGDDNLPAESDLYIKLYYANDAGDKLIPKDESYSYDRSVSVEQYVLERLCINGIDNGAVNKAYTKDGICYVDFNEKINAKDYVGINSDVLLYAVVNSLTELKDVTGVKITIDGRDDVLFRGEIPLNDIFRMNLDIIE